MKRIDIEIRRLAGEDIEWGVESTQLRRTNLATRQVERELIQSYFQRDAGIHTKEILSTHMRNRDISKVNSCILQNFGLISNFMR